MSKPPSDIPPPASSSSDVFSDAVSPGRRDFLKLTAAAGATFLGGCLNDDDDPQQELGATAASIAKFDHMVVVMFENRSFDGLLGYCYQATDPPPRNQTFNGLAGKEYRNPVPAYINDGSADVATRISPGTEADMQNPNPDPGEEYQHVNTALFSIVNPITNQFLDAGAMLSPYNAPPSGTAATMQGFVWDYCNNFVSLNKRNPTFEEYRVIMDSFSPEQLPVINGLAKGFAVYDAWLLGADADASQPVLLPRVELIRLRGEPGARGIREVAALEQRADHLQPTVRCRKDLARLLRCNADRADDRADPRLDAGSVLGQKLLHDGRVLPGRRQRDTTGVRVRRAAQPLQQQRLPSAGALGPERSNRRLVGRPRRGFAGARHLHRRQGERNDYGVERAQYAAARHIRRAWQLLRPCGATDGHDTAKSPARG
jgi:hypothetical protein